MNYLHLIPLLVTAAPAIVVGAASMISGVESSIRETIRQ